MVEIGMWLINTLLLVWGCLVGLLVYKFGAALITFFFEVKTPAHAKDGAHRVLSKPQ